MREGAWLGGALALGLACGGQGYFVCTDRADCGGGEGVCEPVGACSFPDAACPSGRRYGDASTPLVAGECVEPLGDSTGATTSGPSATSGLADDDGGETTGAGTTGDPIPVETTGGRCPDGWWDCAWAHRHRVTVEAAPSTVLDDVPVLVLLSSARVDHDRMQADGEDLRFVSTSGAPLPYEIERWDPAGVSVLWVGIDTLGAGDDGFWIYYGNPVAEGAPSPAEVWGPTHVGVWHLGEDILDASGQANDATPNGGVEAAAGQIGEARDFTNNTARLDVAPAPSIEGLFTGGGTVSAWIRPRGWGQGDFGRVVQKEQSGAGWLFYVGGGGRLRFAVDYEGGNETWTTPEGAISLHTWTHVAAAFDAVGTAPPRLYVDGVEQVLDAPVMVPARAMPSDETVPLTIGNRPANDRRFFGRIDEVRLEKAARSPEWIDLQHRSMRDALLTFGPREEQEDAS